MSGAGTYPIQTKGLKLFASNEVDVIYVVHFFTFLHFLHNYVHLKVNFLLQSASFGLNMLQSVVRGSLWEETRLMYFLLVYLNHT